MSKGFNYNKWDKIELSDDESDCHPNIDKDSWFRMKHRSRLEREQKEDVEVKDLERFITEHQGRLAIIRSRINALRSGKLDADAEFEDEEALVIEETDLSGQIDARKKRIAEVKERRAWNIDNICHVTEEKTEVNSNVSVSLKAEDFAPTGHTEKALEASQNKKIADASAAASADAVPDSVFTTIASASASAAAAATSSSASPSTSTPTASTTTPVAAAKAKTTSTPKSSSSSSSSSAAGPKESIESTGRQKFAVISYNDYVIKHEALLETYSEIRDLNDTQEFLFKHCDILLHEHAQSYMLLSCLEDEMNGKHIRMKLVCRQSQILSHITELGVSMRRDPRDVIIPFFRRIQEREYLTGFLQSVTDFTERIKARSIVKRKEMDAERRQEEREKEGGVAIGPGGLDPYEVLASLPQALQDAFESQEISQLQAVLGAMDPVDAKRYMKMCVDSGLWVPADQSVFEEEEQEGEGDAETAVDVEK